ncbi:hypothetical protein D3C73_1371460 [compost metagenome]
MRPFPAAARGWTRSDDAGMSLSAHNMATKDTVLMRNTQPGPTTTVSTPETAGPIIRATLKEALLRATALGR